MIQVSTYHKSVIDARTHRRQRKQRVADLPSSLQHILCICNMSCNVISSLWPTYPPNLLPGAWRHKPWPEPWFHMRYVSYECFLYHVLCYIPRATQLNGDSSETNIYANAIVNATHNTTMTNSTNYIFPSSWFILSHQQPDENCLNRSSFHQQLNSPSPYTILSTCTRIVIRNKLMSW